MAKALKSQKVYKEILGVMEHRMGMVPDELTPTANISAWFDGDPNARHAFIRELEERVGIDIDDVALERCETFQDLCDWCASHSGREEPRRERDDDEDREEAYYHSHYRRRAVKKVLMPLFLGIVVAGGVVAFIWWRRGCPKFW